MLISDLTELRLHDPSNSFDSIENLNGLFTMVEQDFLADRLGKPLYDRLCQYYKETYYDTGTQKAFYDAVVSGSYMQSPYLQLLFSAQNAIVEKALASNTFSQAVSFNGTSVNMVSGNDFGNADDRALDKSKDEKRVKAYTSLNNLLKMLEMWCKETITDDEEKQEIVTLWKQSRFYYYISDLLIPDCTIFMEFYNIADNRDKFIRLLPDMRFVQKYYIEDAIGRSLVQWLLKADKGKEYADIAENILLDVRYLMVSYLEQRTTVLTIDKARRQQAHDESVALKANLVTYLRASQKSLPEDVAKQCPFYAPELWQEPEPTPSATATTESRTGQQGKTFRTRLMY